MASLERIYHDYRDFVYRICVRYARNADDAEDMTQETFIKVSGRLIHFRGDSGIGTWLYRVAVNCCLDHLRHRRREDRNHQSYLDGMVVRNLAPDGDRIMARLILDRILGRIRPVQRQILFLTLAEGLSCAEAAELLKLSPAAVSKSVNRFLKKHGKTAHRVPGNPDNDTGEGAIGNAARVAPGPEAREKTHG